MDRHVKIIATLGPATGNEEAIRNLVESGAKIFRLNFSHGGTEFFREMVRIIRMLEEETGLTLTIMQDLCGPKVRTCDVGLGTLEINKGTELWLGTPETYKEVDGPFICLDMPELFEIIEVGEPVALSDGMLRFDCIEKVNDHLFKLRAINNGMAPPRKGISFPGKTTPLAALTDKDRADLAVGMELGVDVVAMSYVQKPEDICQLRAEMIQYGRRVPIIAKIERIAAVDDLDRILDEADGVMVARGDLGLEMDLAALPAAQKRIIQTCNQRSKPVIVATQMLLSMVNSPMATRAETTDCANAIIDGADCLMLSEETAIGNFAAETVGFMREIVYETEKFQFADTPEPKRHGDHSHPAMFLAYAAALLAVRTDARAIVTHSTSGATARILSACRPGQSIYCLSPDPVARHFANMSWGVIPVEPPTGVDGHQARAEAFVSGFNEFKKGDQIVVTAGQPRETQAVTHTNVVKLFEK